MTKRKRFPGCTRDVSRHGKVCWRVRRTVKGKRYDFRIHERFGSEEFIAAYEDGFAEDHGPKSAHGSIDNLIERYFLSADWKDLRHTTKKAKRGRLDWIRSRVGRFPFPDLKPEHVVMMMAKKRGPYAANRLHSEVSELFGFARRNMGFTGPDPTASVARRKVKSDGFHTWKEGEVQTFRDFYPTGTMARLAFELAVGTGAARQDLARMGAGNLRGGAIRYERGKTGEPVELPLAKLPHLAAELSARNQLGPVFVTHGDGQPYTVEGFGNWFRDRVADAELPKRCSIHGLRKYGATRLAENGATEWEVMAFLGHSSPHESRKYVKAANRVSLVSNALGNLPENQNLPNLSKGSGKSNR